MPRGGKRPGAGAPKGNLNALKHGLRSQQLRQLTQQLACNPDLRAALARFAQLYARQRSALKARAAATLAVATWLRYTQALQKGGSWPGPVPPPPFSYRQSRILAKHIAHQTIKQGLYHWNRRASMNDLNSPDNQP